MNNRFTILGPPGTGKTTTLSRRVFRAVFEEDVSPSKIVIVSLTKTAAREIAARVRSNNVDLEHVGTLHALARRALVAIGRNVDMIYKPELIESFNKTYGRRLPRSLGQFNGDSVTNADALALGDISRRVSLGQDRKHWPPGLRKLKAQWDAFKYNNSVIDFDDLIIEAVLYCKEHPARPELIIVDEAQDLSSMELELIGNWSKGCKTIIAGDDQQALYEWRGASVKGFMEFSPEWNRHVLAKSYRMKSKVHRYATDVGNRIKTKIDKEYEPLGEGGRVLRGLTTNAIHRLRSAIEFNDSVMFLATCGYMLNPWLHEMKRWGIPYHNPYRTSSEGKTWNPLNNKEAKICRVFLRPWMSGGPRWSWKEVMAMASYLEEPILMNQDLYLRRKDAVRAFDMPNIMLPSFIKAAQTGDLNYFVSRTKRQYRSCLAGQRHSMKPMMFCNRVGPVALFSEPKLIVGTIHSVKGGQADSVFLLPDLSPSAYKGMQTAAGRDSVHRTMYVGVSRAKHELNLLVGRKRMEYSW